MNAYAVSRTVSRLLSHSTHREVKILGFLALRSFRAANYSHAAWFISVWCFFAALLSVVIYLHFAFREAEHDRPKPSHGITVHLETFEK